MKRSVAAVATSILALAVLSVYPLTAMQAPSLPMMTDRFGWLAGCWGGEGGSSVYHEIWTAVSPDLMLGMSATVQPSQPSKPPSFEFLRIVRSKDAFAYIAQPGGVPPTTFTMADVSKPDLNIFVNMDHDFPKRVVYQRVDAKTLLAWIDGGEGVRKIAYPMTRGGKGCE